jgi:hypothetical protein
MKKVWWVIVGGRNGSIPKGPRQFKLDFTPYDYPNGGFERAAIRNVSSRILGNGKSNGFSRRNLKIIIIQSSPNEITERTVTLKKAARQLNDLKEALFEMYQSI